MMYYLFRLALWAAPATPTLLALGILLLSQPLACLLRLAWAAAAALLLKDCDFVTKILPEDKTKWPGRVAWVTGASSGIGLSLVRHLAARGCYLILSSRKEEDLKAARDDAIAFARATGVERSEKDFLLLPFDLKERETFTGVVETGRKWKGRIDLLFSNAGIACRGIMLPSVIDQEILDVNLCSQMHFVKLVVALMMQQHKGQAIITNSMSARIALGGRTAYSAAKAGLLNFAYGLSRELRGMHSPVTITSVLPGYVKTDLCDRELYADHVSLSKGAHIAEDIRTGLSADRSAELILRGSSRGLREIWVGKNPDLFYMYCMYYVPCIANRVVDQGAAAYLRSIEHEIRERHYAQRRATVIGDNDKGGNATQQKVSSFSPSEPLGSSGISHDNPVLRGETGDRNVGEEVLPGESDTGVAERQIPSIFPPSATDVAKAAADAVADAATQLQESATMKLKDATGVSPHQKTQQHQNLQPSQHLHQSQHRAEAGQRKREGEQAAPGDNAEGRHTRSHTGGAEKHRGSESHTTTPDKQKETRDFHTSNAAERKHRQGILSAFRIRHVTEDSDAWRSELETVSGTLPFLQCSRDRSIRVRFVTDYSDAWLQRLDKVENVYFSPEGKRRCASAKPTPISRRSGWPLHSKTWHDKHSYFLAVFRIVTAF